MSFFAASKPVPDTTVYFFFRVTLLAQFIFAVYC